MEKNNSVTIGDVVVAPGQRANVNLPVADLYTATSLCMPLQIICGRNAGPTLFVSAAVHGDELNGVEIIRRLLRRKVLKSLSGTLLAVPIVNVHGFINQSRYLPDRRDLNRSFPGSARGSVAARLANIFLEQVVAKANYGIDLHTGAIDRSNLPQIRGNMDDAMTLELGKAFGAPVMLNADVRDGSLRGSAADLGLPVLIYEAGEALRFDEFSIRAGLRGILNVMRAIGMLPPSKGRNPARRSEPVLASYTRWVRSPTSGIVGQMATLGNTVSKGQRLATIGDPLGIDEDILVAPFDGIIIGRSNLPLAYEGEALFNIAAFDDVEQAENLVEEYAAEYQPEPHDS